MTAQHPRRFIMGMEARCQQIRRGVIARFRCGFNALMNLGA
jgi:hypothetical protein